jgi:phosphate starvation-inducible PhoH-like protein
MSTSKKARKSAPQQTTSQIKINGFEPIIAKNYAQGQYLESIRTRQITFGIGSAGTGKTYIATAYAAEQLYYKKVDKVILTRPAVEAAGESLGFLPGELIEGKLLPYMVPYLETFSDLLGQSFLAYCLKVGYIEPVPLAFMRGRSFKNCLILADEMQSATSLQMQLLLTRIGENSKLIINGDIAQRDDKNVNGLEDATNRLGGLQEVDIVRFHDNDCVRSGLCKKVLQAYSS